jgi:hypothetical protein
MPSPTAAPAASLSDTAARVAAAKEQAVGVAKQAFALFSRGLRAQHLDVEQEDDVRLAAREAANAIVTLARRGTYSQTQQKTIAAAHQLATAVTRLGGIDDPMLAGQLRALGKRLSAYGVDVGALKAAAPRPAPPAPMEFAPQQETSWKRTKEPSAPQGVIAAADGWKLLRLSPDDVREVERRDRDKIRAWAAGYRPECPDKRRDYQIADEGPDTYSVRARIKQGRKWHNAGELRVVRAPDYPSYFVSEYSNVPLHILAECDGMGNEMYRLAAEEACRRGGVLTGSHYRSPFSENFWKKQIREGRAECDTSDHDGTAEIYEHPVADLYEGLIDGSLPVPLYNKLRSRIRPRPASGHYDCYRVPLKRAWCALPDAKRIVRNTSRRRTSRRR